VIAMMELSFGRRSEALATARRSVELDSVSPMPRAMLATTLLATGHADSARVFAQNILLHMGRDLNARLDWATPFSNRALLLPGQIATAATQPDGTDDNFHEKSMAGSYKPGLGFTNDLMQSPTLDRGAPADAFANEPAPAGGYINLGAYGNTATASKSPAKYILLTNPNGGERLPQKTTYTIRWRSDPDKRYRTRRGWRSSRSTGMRSQCEAKSRGSDWEQKCGDRRWRIQGRPGGPRQDR